MKLKCDECEGDVDVPNDSISGEVVSCGDCGTEYEVIKDSDVKLKRAESVGEDWGE